MDRRKLAPTVTTVQGFLISPVAYYSVVLCTFVLLVPYEGKFEKKIPEKVASKAFAVHSVKENDVCIFTLQ